MENTQTLARNARQRVDGISLDEGRELLRRVHLTVTPNSLSLRKTIKELIPEIYLLHSQGFDFAQIAGFLGQINIKIQVGTLKTYYHEFIAKKMALCLERMNEQLLILNEIKKETAGHDSRVVSKEVAAAVVQQKTSIRNRVDRILSKHQEQDYAAKSDDIKKNDVTESKPVVTSKKFSPKIDTSPFEGEFDLLTDTGPVKSAKSNIFSGEGEPEIPDLSMEISPSKNSNVAAASPPHSRLQCGKLQTGVKELSRRPGVPDEVYDEELILEHPAIPGLLLTKAQRLYGAQLELIDESGQTALESPRFEQHFRIKWQKPIPVMEGKTSKNFTQMDESLFNSKSKS
jgi:hypothetical protein